MLKGQVWKNHGELVAAAASYLPGSFDKAPRNPAEKINSGYKAWEYLLYVFGLCPGLLHGVLPNKYWENLCKLTVAIHILHQRSISAAQLRRAYILVLEFIKEFELLFYQKKVERIHFCRPALHGLVHNSTRSLSYWPRCLSQPMDNGTNNRKSWRGDQTAI